MTAVVDNDIILKCACYGLFDELPGLAGSSATVVGVLGAARFVVSRRIRRISLNRSREKALERLNAFLARSTTLEPTNQEIELAAAFELAAQQAAVSLDTGESQLCAIAISRAIPSLLTGDKRAIRALQTLLDRVSRLLALCGKVGCLEQLMLAAIDAGNGGTLRAAICAEPKVDRALAICFSCKNNAVSEQDIKDGLNSYISDLRASAVRILAV